MLAQPKWIQEPSDVKMRKGQSISVVCKAEGFPKPVIKWKSLNSNTVFENEILQLTPAKLVDDKYECIADNGVGTPLTKLIRVLLNGLLRFIY